MKAGFLWRIARLHWLVAVVLAAFAGSLMGPAQARPATPAKAPACGELAPCEGPSRFRHVKAIRVLANGITRGQPEPGLRCAQFKLTAGLVRRYLSLAGEVSANAQHYAGSDSTCVAEGTFRYAPAGKHGSAEQAHWTIGVLGEARIRLADGGEVLLACARCRFKPFVFD